MSWCTHSDVPSQVKCSPYKPEAADYLIFGTLIVLKYKHIKRKQITLNPLILPNRDFFICLYFLSWFICICLLYRDAVITLDTFFWLYFPLLLLHHPYFHISVFMVIVLHSCILCRLSHAHASVWLSLQEFLSLWPSIFLNLRFCMSFW